MLLSARLLNHYANINQFEQALQLEFTEGDPVTVYLQLVDLTKNKENKPLTGMRYVPASGSTLSVVIKSVDGTKTLTKTATNPEAGDRSVWSFSLSSTDSVKGTVSLQLTLTEGAVVKRGRVDNALMAYPLTQAYVVR
jgi:hypothetical protein